MDVIRCAVLFLEHSRDVYAVIRRKDTNLPTCSVLAAQPFSLLRQLMTGAGLCCSGGHVDPSREKVGRVGLYKLRRCRHHADKIKAHQTLKRTLNFRRTSEFILTVACFNSVVSIKFVSVVCGHANKSTSVICFVGEHVCIASYIKTYVFFPCTV